MSSYKAVFVQETQSIQENDLLKIFLETISQLTATNMYTLSKINFKFSRLSFIYLQKSCKRVTS